MRTLSLWGLIVSLLLPGLVLAETTPATAGYKYAYGWNGALESGYTYATDMEACVAEAQRYITLYSLAPSSLTTTCAPAAWGGSNSQSCNCGGSNGSKVTVFRQSAFVCDTAHGWTGPTLIGGVQTCSRPDCEPGATRQADGSCLDPCASRAQNSPTTGWYSSNVGSPSLEGTNYCDSNCTVALNPAPSGYSYTNGKLRWQQYQKVELGYACTTGLASAPTAAVDPNKPVEPEKKPPCDVSEGVLTSSTGTIACVPPGVPGSTTPIVQKQKTVEPYPDGSTKTIEVIVTRDPSTGVEDKRINTTITPASGGGAGQAGTPGTSSSSGTSSTTSGGDQNKPADSDFCAKNPNLQMCKGGMNEEATQKEVLKALKPEGTADTSSVDGAKSDYEAKATEHKSLFDTIMGKGQSDEGGMLSWALIPEAPAGACAPFTGTLAGRAITLDWCEELERIRTIAGYAFYILTLFGLFRIFTEMNGGSK